MSQRHVESRCRSSSAENGSSTSNATSTPPDGVSHWLIRHAAHRAPEALSERLEEEWLADLADRASPMSRLRFALGCCWATRVIALENRLSPVPAATSAVAPKLAAFLGAAPWAYLSRRSSTFLLIVTLHLALFYALMNLAHPHKIAIQAPLQNHPVNVPEKPKMLPPLIEPKLQDLTADIRRDELKLPQVEITKPDDNSELVRQPPHSPEPPVPEDPSTHVANHIPGGPGAGFPNPDDFYPSAARHLGEQGVATVRVCVDPNGRLTTDPTTTQGTGSARLDVAAVALARAGSGHYRPSTEDGRPVESCYPLRIRFQIKN